ncbi:MAG: hypothetical protein WDZ51_03880 [Pirellulaceae bacterium]
MSSRLPLRHVPLLFACLFLWGCGEIPAQPNANPANAKMAEDGEPVSTDAALPSVEARAEPEVAPDDFMLVSDSSSPQVCYALRRQGENLTLVIQADSFESDGSGVSVKAGIRADKTLNLDGEQATTTPTERGRRFQFVIPTSELVTNDSGWNKLRLAFSVEWAGGPLGQPRLRQRFLHTTPAAPHAELSSDVAHWQPLDLSELERQAADRASQIVIDFEQPMDGKSSIVLEDADGNRVRNLVSGQALAEGTHRVVWDGLDESGNAVSPADYRWRAISHPGLKPVHEFDFANAPGSNHGTFQAASTNGNVIVLGTPVSEGGHQVVALEKNGTFLQGFNAPHGIGLGRIALAADQRYIYAFYDGRGWGAGQIDRNQADWKAEMKINLVRFDLDTGRVADYSSNNRMPLLLEYEIGPGSPGAQPDELALHGVALSAGRLYLANGFSDELMEIDPASGKVERSFPLANVVALASDGEQLFAIIETNQLVAVDPKSGETRPIGKVEGEPAGLAVGPDGRFYVSDRVSHLLRQLDKQGQEVSVIGTPGGLVPGPYDPQQMSNPAGVAISGDYLWVTEDGRWTPKRYAVYDTRTGKAAQEFFGPTNYGAQGAGFDPTDHTHWLGQGASWKLDFEAREATPVSVLGGAISGKSEVTRRHTFWRQDDRTFIITSGKATYIQEMFADGTLRPLACLSSAHQFSYSHGWNPPEEFLNAFRRDYPNVKYVPGTRGQPTHGYGMLWVDRNGDGEMQAEEIEFATAAKSMAGSGWSHDFHDLTLRVPGTVDGQNVLITLKPDGWWPGGAPRYPALNDAVKAAVPIEMPGTSQVESAVDRFGNTILNSEPEMHAVDPEGRLLWTYPNQWNGVHGSHKAPLPSPGELQGVLFFSGVVPLDDQGDVMLMNGNHGRAFVMTTDGLYIDEMFPDVRLMNNSWASGVGILGGECFGGTFGYSEKNGNYYFQGGGIAYRIYRVEGLRETHRSEGTVSVAAAQAAAAERDRIRLVVDKSEARSATISWRSEAPVIDGKEDDWSGSPTAQWDSGGRFPVTVQAAHDGKKLYLHYTVQDESPWVNNGDDWQSLFKTGDGIDLQLGTDHEANPKRGAPVPGDLRLFIAPQGEKNVAVLYRHRVPEGDGAEEVVFQSPWRSEKVDVVRRLEAAEIAVERSNNLYRVEVALPLAELGLADSAGQSLRGDFGVIYGDREGTVNVFRNYWSNQATGLVNDVPGEIMLTPTAWGDLTFGTANTPNQETQP